MRGYRQRWCHRTGVTGFIGSELDDRYLAPEVSADPGAASFASDVYALAKIGLELLVSNHRESDDVSTELRQVPDRWRETLKRALAADPAERPETAELLLGELRDSRAASWISMISGPRTRSRTVGWYVVVPVVKAAPHVCTAFTTVSRVTSTLRNSFVTNSWNASTPSRSSDCSRSCLIIR